MNHIKVIALFAIAALYSASAFARVNGDVNRKPIFKTAASCAQTSATIDLDINNVRAKLMNGGDMWWDRGAESPAYEVPKGSGKNALFAGSLWIGGYDINKTLKVAAQTYRQNGNDYWAGPLTDTGTVDAATCSAWDRFWKINRTDINKFRSIYVGLTDQNAITAAILSSSSSIADVIKEWPATGNVDAKGYGKVALNLSTNKSYAPFKDVDGDNIYNWTKGDYPEILGDQYIWWVFNDKGNVKTETSSLGIGLEVQTAAFAFSTSDYLNDATFYNYKVINKAESALDSTYMSTWSDADLGWYKDDYVACDVTRNLGILYNGDALDEGNTGYGTEIPQVGVDFFRGPKPDASSPPLGMTAFMYFNNDGSPHGNPDKAQDFYNYMTGSWRDGSRWTNTCNGFAPGTITKFLYPLQKECECNNVPFDRRFVHSSGPFTLLPGQVNDITIGAIWVPDAGGGCSGFTKIQLADDKAQQLFIDNFKLRFGPQAPDLIATPYDAKIVFYLNNPYGSNNFRDNYGNTDSAGVNENRYLETASKPSFIGHPDSFYKFEGYVVYQLKNENVTISSIRNSDGSINSDKARIVFQCDKKNGIKKLFNYELDPESNMYVPRLMVSGKDSGISNNFALTTDAFSLTSDRALINYKTYYYVAIAYGQNTFAKFDAQNPQNTQDREFIESRSDGRENPIRIIKVIPTPTNDKYFTQNQTTYGSGIALKRIEGRGNSGLFLDLSEASVNEALSAGTGYISKMPVYNPGFTPVSIKVTSPDSIKAGYYEIFVKVDSSYNNLNKDSSLGAYAPRSSWFITRTLEGNSVADTIYSEKNLTEYNEQLLTQWGSDVNPTSNWGFAINMKQVTRPGDSAENAAANGFIGADMNYDDPGKPWLLGVPDQDGNSPLNWIRSGATDVEPNTTWYNDCNMDDYTISPTAGSDRAKAFGNILGGTFSPYNLLNGFNYSRCNFAYMYNRNIAQAPILTRNANPLMNTQSVDIVLTQDKSKWTRCSVVEMNEGQENTMIPLNSEGGAAKYNLRQHPSWDMQWDSQGNPIYNTADTGHSWFPGYAINVETGERLNIVFGEDSWLKANNGADMIWNPTSTYFDPVNSEIIWGGRHVVYISNTRYDAYPGGPDNIWNTLRGISKGVYSPGGAVNPSVKDDVYGKMIWATIPILNSQFKFLPFEQGYVPTGVKVRLRVNRPFSRYQGDAGQALRNNAWPLYSFDSKDIAPYTLDDSRNTYNNDIDGLLKNIKAVPNPYYGYSGYETGRLDSRIRITNLTDVATIKIYQADGSLVKTIQKNDASSTFVDWDLKNDKSVPISSGMYLIHVRVKTALGDKETIVKWFGVMRPLDITSF